MIMLVVRDGYVGFIISVKTIKSSTNFEPRPWTETLSPVNVFSGFRSLHFLVKSEGRECWPVTGYGSSTSHIKDGRNQDDNITRPQ